MALLLFVLALCLPWPLRAAPFPYTLHWKRLVPGIVGGALVQCDSLVFVGTTDGRVLAVDRADGVRRWQRRGYGPVHKGLVLVDGAPAFADAWGGVRILASADGAEGWSFRRQGRGDAALVVGSDLLYGSGADGWLYALGRVDGREHWRVRVGARLAGRPLLESDRLYVPTADGRLLVVDEVDGALLHSVDIGALASDGVHVGAGFLLAAFGDGYVRAYEKDALDLKWQRRIGAKTSLAVFSKAILCAADNGWLYGLYPRDGRILWRQDLGAAPLGAAVKGPRGEAVIGTATGRVLAIDPISGALAWDVQLLEGRGAYVAQGEGGFFVRGGDDYLYAFGEVEPLGAEGDVLWERWWQVLDRGRKTGYRRQQLLRGDDGGQPIFRIAEEMVQWRGSFRRGEGQVLVGSDFQPIAVEERVIEGSQVVEFSAHWHGDSLRVERRLAGHRVRASAWVDQDAVPIEMALLKLWREGRAKSGRRDSLRVIDYDYLESQWLGFDFGAEEETPAGKGLAVRVHSLGDSTGPELLVWADGAGRPLRMLDPETGAEQRQVDEATARAWVPPGRGRGARISHALANPSAVEELLVALPDSLADLHFIEDRRQAIEKAADGNLRLLVRATPYDGRDALELPIRDNDLAPYLQSSLYIQVEDLRIQELARALRGDERDAWKVALRLRQWVYDHMVPRDTNVRFKSTLEVLEDMEGTCSEYAALYLALCRAVGLPARAAVGFIASHTGELVLHIWTQVYVGEWIDLDPSWAAETVDAAHIKTGQGLLTASGQRRLNGTLAQWLARVDTLELVEYTADDQRFSSAAERLFAEGSQAEKRFVDVRAQELYHQIVLLPWNHRSAQALVHIARYRLQHGDLDDAEWALGRLLRQEGDDRMEDGLFYRARLAAARDQPDESRTYLERLVRDFPDGDLADDALGQLAERAQEEGGCQAALPFYQRLREEYSRTGWASVAESALTRCSEGRLDQP